MWSRCAALAVLCAALPAAAQQLTPLTPEQAVAIALQRNRDAIAARLDIEAAELDKVAASVYWNPVFSYTVGNLVLGAANGQQETPPVTSGFFGQTVHNVSVSEVIDVWMKRNARIETAERGIEHKRYQVEDALREIAYAVRTAYAEVQREASELELARETRSRFDETIRISRARQAAGDISEAELRKIELEGMTYANAVIDEELTLDLARQKLLALLALPSSAPLALAPEPKTERNPLQLAPLLQRAMERRPDLRAARLAHPLAEAELRQAKREALPDIALGLGYTHSEFTASGDNPNSLALSLSFPLTLFDRNQANVGRARLDLRRADNDVVRLQIAIEHEVADAVRRTVRADALLDTFEQGGMLEKVEQALRVAEKSYKAGSLSLLELLEAQRTYIEQRARYVHAQHDWRQSMIDVSHAVGGE